MAFTVSATTPSDSVLRDLIADSWFQAQHDVLANRGPLVTAAPAPADVTAHDRWSGSDAEIHAFLALHPAF